MSQNTRAGAAGTLIPDDQQNTRNGGVACVCHRRANHALRPVSDAQAHQGQLGA
jgi:hypothetical protein